MPILVKMIVPDSTTKREFQLHVAKALVEDVFIECSYIDHKSITMDFETQEHYEKFLRKERSKADVVRVASSIGELLDAKG